jgi:hypothetical protein
MAQDADLFAGKYRIVKLLGEGGMGKVHAAISCASRARWPSCRSTRSS